MKIAVVIDEEQEHIHLTMRIHRDEKIYYSHEVNIYKRNAHR